MCLSIVAAPRRTSTSGSRKYSDFSDQPSRPVVLSKHHSGSTGSHHPSRRSQGSNASSRHTNSGSNYSAAVVPTSSGKQSKPSTTKHPTYTLTIEDNLLYNYLKSAVIIAEHDKFSPDTAIQPFPMITNEDIERSHRNFGTTVQGKDGKTLKTYGWPDTNPLVIFGRGKRRMAPLVVDIPGHRIPDYVSHKAGEITVTETTIAPGRMIWNLDREFFDGTKIDTTGNSFLESLNLPLALSVLYFGENFPEKVIKSLYTHAWETARSTYLDRMLKAVDSVPIRRRKKSYR